MSSARAEIGKITYISDTAIVKFKAARSFVKVQLDRPGGTLRQVFVVPRQFLRLWVVRLPKQLRPPAVLFGRVKRNVMANRCAAR
jgi:hypothetical protein